MEDALSVRPALPRDTWQNRVSALVTCSFSSGLFAAQDGAIDIIELLVSLC
jgi:hypothetical protein